jgi:hypothetical protein
MTDRKPIIPKKDRPTAIDYDAPIAEWRVKDLMAVLDSRIAELVKPEKESLKPPEKEFHKPPEKEYFKPPEKEFLKPEKETLKPEKELSKPEKETGPGFEERVARVVINVLEERGLLKK